MTRYLIGILLLFFCFSNAQAQTGVVKGTVRDTKGSALPGVTIQVKGANRSTSTDVNGKFAIEAAKGSVLQFSFIGFQSSEITVGDGGGG